MRIYKEGETVRLPDDTLATVVEAMNAPYILPPGQSLGGGPANGLGGEMQYKVKLADGSIIMARDRDVRNPPRAS